MTVLLAFASCFQKLTGLHSL